MEGGTGWAPAAVVTGEIRQNGSVNLLDPPAATDAVAEGDLRALLLGASDLARTALIDSEDAEAGEHLGFEMVGDTAGIHRFAAELNGYRGWQWAVVVAAVAGADVATVSETALLPGPDAILAPEWVPWKDRVRPGDLSPGDLLPPHQDDPRLEPGYVATGDPEIDDVALELGLGRPVVMSREGRLDTAERWGSGDFGPDADMAKAAPGHCITCGFFLSLAGSLRAAFGVCGNEMAADGRVVHVQYGCGAHSRVRATVGAGSPVGEPFDDNAIDALRLPPPLPFESDFASTDAAEVIVAEAADVVAVEVAADAAVADAADEVVADEGVAEAEPVTVDVAEAVVEVDTLEPVALEAEVTEVAVVESVVEPAESESTS